jgi:hypothetical protein
MRLHTSHVRFPTLKRVARPPSFACWTIPPNFGRKHPATHRVQEELNVEQRHCNNLKPYTMSWLGFLVSLPRPSRHVLLYDLKGFSTCFMSHFCALKICDYDLCLVSQETASSLRIVKTPRAVRCLWDLGRNSTQITRSKQNQQGRVVELLRWCIGGRNVQVSSRPLWYSFSPLRWNFSRPDVSSKETPYK